MPTEIAVQFLPETETLPDPDTCTNSLKLPTCHMTYEEFESAFDATVRIQGKGYGRPQNTLLQICLQKNQFKLTCFKITVPCFGKCLFMKSELDLQ